MIVHMLEPCRCGDPWLVHGEVFVGEDGTQYHRVPDRKSGQFPQVVDTSAEQDYPARLASPDE